MKWRIILVVNSKVAHCQVNTKFFKHISLIKLIKNKDNIQLGSLI